MHDVIVVGGGVVGATVAYLCAREGLKTRATIEPSGPARSADGWTATSPSTE